MRIIHLISALRRIARLKASSTAMAPAAQMSRAADGAFEFTAEIVINAAPRGVYPLLDPSARGNRWTARGDLVEAIDRANGLYRLRDQRMPEAPVLLQIDKAAPSSAITVATYRDGGRPIGAISKSTSFYSIASAATGCVVSLTERTVFIDGLSPRDIAQHAKMMTKAVGIDLQRLKDEAEAAADDRVAARA